MIAEISFYSWRELDLSGIFLRLCRTLFHRKEIGYNSVQDLERA